MSLTRHIYEGEQTRNLAGARVFAARLDAPRCAIEAIVWRGGVYFRIWVDLHALGVGAVTLPWGSRAERSVLTVEPDQQHLRSDRLGTRWTAGELIAASRTIEVIPWLGTQV